MLWLSWAWQHKQEWTSYANEWSHVFVSIDCYTPSPFKHPPSSDVTRLCITNKTIWCTLNALVLPCVLFGALWMLWCCHVYYLVHSECSGVAMCTIWCTLDARVPACVWFGALWCTLNASISHFLVCEDHCQNDSATHRNSLKTDHHCATPSQAHSCKIRMSCQGGQ